MIIDAHAHLDDVTNTKLSAKKRLNLLIKNMEKNRVSHSFILADIPTLPHEKFLSHEEMLKLISHYPQLHLVGKVPLHVAQNLKYLNRTRKYIKNGEIIGIKLYPGYEKFYPNDPRYSPLYDICEEFDIPIMFHSGDVMDAGHLRFATPLHIDEVASERPKMKIIICHMGNPWQLDTAAVTYKNKNVYADTAGLFYHKLDIHMEKFLDHKLEEFIRWNPKAEKLIFGSDWPITSVGDTIKLIKDLPHFMDKDKELIFSKNAKRLFKIK